MDAKQNEVESSWILLEPGKSSMATAFFSKCLGMALKTWAGLFKSRKLGWEMAISFQEVVLSCAVSEAFPFMYFLLNESVYSAIFPFPQKCINNQLPCSGLKCRGFVSYKMYWNYMSRWNIFVLTVHCKSFLLLHILYFQEIQ